MLWIMVAGLAAFAPVPKDAAVADALKALAGEWVVVESETFGRKGELHVGDVFKFDGDGLAHHGRGKPLEYRLSVRPKHEPSQMDWRPSEPKDAKWSHRGIYKINGNKLTICVLSHFEAENEKDRPSEFRTKAGRENGEAAGNVLLVLERKRR
jgi:uncharacterized protein (TIGR03067 family)